jgi:MoxR-like ATPase
MNDVDPSQTVEHFRQRIERVQTEVHKLIVGQQDVLEGLLTCLLAGGHALIEGVPGLGKTALVRSLAAALDLRFARVQFTPDLMPADILGTTLIREQEGGRHDFEFEAGPIFANVVLADEINRTTPKTQSALLEAMQEGSVTVAKTTHRLPDPFLVLATQNPLEMEGTYPLPEAQLDRFLLKLHASYPAHDELHDILDRTTGSAQPTVSAVLTQSDVLEMSHRDRPSAPPLVRRFVRFGASPRGAQACLIAAKTRALLAGRFHVAFEDIRAVAKPALRHRLILNFEGEAEGVTSDQVLDEILTSLPEITR